MITRAVVLASLLTLCVTARAAPLVRVTITDAQIAATKKDGHTWDEPAKDVPSVLSRLVCAALPTLVSRAQTCGEGGAVSPTTPHTNPDPFVRITLGDRVIQSAVYPNSLQPSWRYSFLLDGATQRKGAHVAVVDFDGGNAGEEIGSIDLPPGELTRAGKKSFAFGAVKRLGIEVAVIDPRSMRVDAQLEVPSTQAMVDLAIAAAPIPTWRSIPISQGDLVEISATGKVCPSDVDRTACTGPDGFPKRFAKYNDPAFRTCDHCNHAALVAQLGLESMAIGAHRRFVADTSGLLLLGVNDISLKGNRGVYNVTVTINGDPAFGYGAVDDTRDDDASIHAPVSASALSASLIGAAIDKHDDDIATCAASATDGTIVLGFAISGDGSLIGVTVVKADPALKSVAECIRGRALSWKFPRPQGVATVNFPLSFSQEH